MIRIAICDDEAPTRAYLASLIRAQDCPCEVVEYASAGDCLAERRRIDLLFLDIELNAAGLDGMALARQIREGNSAAQPVIIFVTGYERYVFDAFDVGAFQYLLKPVDEEKFAQVFARAAEQIEAGRVQPQLSHALTRIRGLKHEMRGHLTNIRGLAQSGEYDSEFHSRSKGSFWEQRMERHKKYMELAEEAAAKRRLMMKLRMNGGSVSAAELLMGLLYLQHIPHTLTPFLSPPAFSR